VAGAGGFHGLLRAHQKCRGKQVLHNKNIETSNPSDAEAPRAKAGGSPGMQRRILLMNLSATPSRGDIYAQHSGSLVHYRRNDEYGILKSFAALEDTPGVPALDIPGFDIVSIAKGYGCDAARLDDLEAIKKAALEAWGKSKPTVLEIPISPQVPPLF
jgi:hypothetical protein